MSDKPYRRASKALPAIAPAILLVVSGLVMGGPTLAQDWLKGLIDDAETQATDFLPVEQAFPFIVSELPPNEHSPLSNNTVQLQLQWNVTPDYYLYRRSFALKASGGRVISGQLPAGVVVDDIEYGITEVYETPVTLTTTIEANGDGPIELSVQYQGCAKAGLCYPPSVASYTVTANTSPAAANTAKPITVQNSAELKQHIGAGLPVVLEISADWSAASRLMKHQLFKRQDVADALLNVTWLRADVSDIDSVHSERLLDDLDAAGPPAFRFYQTTGAELTELRHNGRISSDNLISAIKAIPATSWPDQALEDNTELQR